ncbi:MAG: Hpt domain-containing protein [Kiritimatiellae bacterium]|nr:Hpt domain-containing protein [Kiritimatiellia bacterium]
MKACCEAYLNEQFAGDKDLMDEIYGLYVDSVNEKLSEANQVIENADWAALDRLAHTIKGNALATGDSDMVQTAIELRSAAQLHEREQSEDLVQRLKVLAGEL